MSDLKSQDAPTNDAAPENNGVAADPILAADLLADASSWVVDCATIDPSALDLNSLLAGTPHVAGAPGLVAVAEVDEAIATPDSPVEASTVEASTVETPEPVAETPAVETPEPVTAPTVESSQVAAPVAETPEPVVETPVVETPEPVTTPTVETQQVEAPVAETSQPAVETPVVETPEPVATPTAETQQVEAPVAETREPVVETPVVETPEPVVTQPASKDLSEKAAVVQTQPAVEPEPAAEPEPAKPKGPRFADLSLDPNVLQAVTDSGYETPTPIQAEIIPFMMEGRDILAQSQTGTGKTAAFALPILSRVDTKRKSPQVLVLAPTRELAIQVADSFSTYASHMPKFKAVAIYGGQDYEPQLRALRRGVQVVVGTPGRVIDHIRKGTLDLSCIECLVLDEADEMLNMGFKEDVEFVLQQTPEERQVALFSATLPQAIRKISEQYLDEPAKITIKKKTMTADSIRQRALFVSPRDKVAVLKRILEAEETDGVIVFTKTKDATITVAEQLVREGVSAIALNGDMPQKVRERTIDQLKSGKLDVLVATDVAARGLDVNRISHVFNYDTPHDTESYVHRIGRTGRAGRKGEAIIFLTNGQRNKLRQIERLTKQKIEVVEPPSADEINAFRVVRFKERLTQVIGARDLTMFKDLIGEYAEESGKPIELIAAALAHIGQNGRPFLMKDLPKAKRRERNDRNDRDRGDRDFGRSSYEGKREKQFGARDRQLGPPEEGMQRYRIEVGRRDGVKPGNIVGAVANEAGIDGEFIGPIKIYDSFPTVDLPEGMPGDIYQSLSKTWVSGKQLQISVDTGGGKRSSFRSDKGFGGKGKGKPGKRGGRPHGKKKFKPKSSAGRGPGPGAKRRKPKTK